MKLFKLGFIFLILMGLSLSPLRAESSKAQLNALVTQLQSAPGDMELRKKIIKLSLNMTKPATTDEVTELSGKAEYIVKEAKSQADYKDAVDAFKQASTLAPWSGDIYYNLAVVQEKAGEPSDAADSYRLYLLAKPHAKDKKTVQKKIGALGYMAVKRSKDLTGAKWIRRSDKNFEEVECSGNTLTFFNTWTKNPTNDPNYNWKHGRYQSSSKTYDEKKTFDDGVSQHGVISEDGQTITITFYGQQTGEPLVYTRE